MARQASETASGRGRCWLAQNERVLTAHAGPRPRSIPEKATGRLLWLFASRRRFFVNRNRRRSPSVIRTKNGPKTSQNLRGSCPKQRVSQGNCLRRWGTACGAGRDRGASGKTRTATATFVYCLRRAQLLHSVGSSSVTGTQQCNPSAPPSLPGAGYWLPSPARRWPSGAVAPPAVKQTAKRLPRTLSGCPERARLSLSPSREV